MFDWIARIAEKVADGVRRVVAIAKAVVGKARGAVASAATGAAVGALIVKAAGYHALGMLGTSAHLGLNAAGLLTAGIVAGAVAGLAIYALVRVAMDVHEGAHLAT